MLQNESFLCEFVIASEDCCVEDDYLSLQLHSNSGKKYMKWHKLKKKSVLSILLPRFLGIVQYITAILSYNHFCTFFAEFRAKYSNYNKLFWII